MTRKDDIALMEALAEASGARLLVLRKHSKASPYIAELYGEICKEEARYQDYTDKAQEHIRIQRQDEAVAKREKSRRDYMASVMGDGECQECAEYLAEVERRRATGGVSGWRAPDEPDCDCERV